MDNIMDNIKYCVQTTKDIIDDNIKQYKQFLLDQHETYLFGGNINKNKKWKLKNILNLNLLIFQELKTITYCEKVSDDHFNNLLSEYGSLYLGTDTFYYNDKLMQYTPQQIYQILLNHICHYLLGYNYKCQYDLTQKSNILLMFDNLGVFKENKQNVLYSQSKRNDLYLMDKYKELTNNTIIFPMDKSVRDYVMENKISNNFIKFYQNEDMDICLRKTFFIIQTAIQPERFLHSKKQRNKMYNNKLVRKNINDYGEDIAQKIKEFFNL